MQITITHNSELRLRKVDALHRIYGIDYPVTGDNHYPSIGEEVEIAKHGSAYDHTRDAQAFQHLTVTLADFKHEQRHQDLTHAINIMESQETLF